MKKHHFCAEIASTDEEKQRGLMFRKSLGLNEGMLFPYKAEKKIDLWMRNTFVSLDIIFISTDKKIGHIHKNAPILSDSIISFPGKFKAIFEVKGGVTDLLSIKVGDKVIY